MASIFPQNARLEYNYVGQNLGWAYSQSIIILVEALLPSAVRNRVVLDHRKAPSGND